MSNSNLPKELRAGDFLGGITNSPYKLSEADLKFKRCFFSFIDILGYKAFLDQHQENAPKEIYYLLKSTYDSHSGSYESIKIKILSDSLLIWTDADQPVHFWNLLNVVELIREAFFKKNLLLRGGISVGKNFIDHDIIVSPALVEAYSLEQIAVTPRILISKEAKEEGSKNLIQNGNASGLKVGEYFRLINIHKVELDFDGQLILAPFCETNGLCFLRTGFSSHYSSGDALPTMEQKDVWEKEGRNDIANIRQQIIASKPKNGSSINTMLKYKYVVNKFNSWVFKYKASPEDIIFCDDVDE